MGAAKKIIIFFSLMVMIFGIIGIVNSWNTYQENKGYACDNMQTALTNLKGSIERLYASGYDASGYEAEYNDKMDFYNKNCK